MDGFKREDFEKILIREMPFGKYKGYKLIDLPVSYLEWFAKKEFPPGQIGRELALVYEIKSNGLMHLLTPLRNNKNK